MLCFKTLSVSRERKRSWLLAWSRPTIPRNAPPSPRGSGSGKIRPARAAAEGRLAGRFVQPHTFAQGTVGNEHDAALFKRLLDGREGVRFQGRIGPIRFHGADGIDRDQSLVGQCLLRPTQKGARRPNLAWGNHPDFLMHPGFARYRFGSIRQIGLRLRACNALERCSQTRDSRTFKA